MLRRSNFVHDIVEQRPLYQVSEVLELWLSIIVVVMILLPVSLEFALLVGPLGFNLNRLEKIRSIGTNRFRSVVGNMP